MKKNIYLLLALLSFSPSMATQKVTKSVIVASTLLLSKTNNYRRFDKKLSLDLHYAIEKNDYVAAQKLINNPQVDINAKVDYGTELKYKGYTPLIVCSAMGDKSFNIAKALLAHKDINVNLQKNNGGTPLIMCSYKGDESFKIATALLAHKQINVNLQDGWTPLDNIVYWIKDNKEYYTYVKVWHLLVAKGGILNRYKNDYNNLNPSDFQEPQRGYVQSIKSNSPRNYISNNTLCEAIRNESYTLALNLINNPYVDVNLQNKDGITPLIMCSWKGDKSFKIATALLAHKQINVNLQNNNGWTPLITCSEVGDETLKIATALLAHNKST